MTRANPRSKGTSDAANGPAELEKPQDPFLLDRIYKNPLAAFLHQPQTVEELKADCLIFLDTNVLLIPYSTSKDSLTSFTDIYKELSNQGRLYLADRVMQEFETNVPDKIKNLFHTLGQVYTPPFINYPLLDGMEEYDALKKADEVFREKLEEYRKASRATQKKIETWDHNDPVRAAYRVVFSNARRARITSLTLDELLKHWNYRLDNKIPPGYKDGGKSDTGIGDYLLWQAVLDTCAELKKSAIVVSSEAKPDWWHKVDGQVLYARRELVEEFRDATDGQTVRLLSPADFLKLFGATKEIIAEIAKEQAIAARPPAPNSTAGWLRKRLRSISLAMRWIKTRLPSEFEISSSNDLLSAVGTDGRDHEFAFKHFRLATTALNFLERYANEEASAATHTAVLIGDEIDAAEDLLTHVLSSGIGLNLIIGHIADDEFFPIYYSKPSQIENLIVD